ncbi:hypothetical protein Vretimale_12369 [Volvox reticuliferus]|uniref:NADP-dependent oxidoreductase domain-containing protein n=1 Tax=Volvox reticuliferus TaxID=1737510 RepID=A0A8J4LSG3_9CHLO|nr:hypothetical protein Vretifemale_8998 [Volvox reticuliferus]GIM08331.1 hypothetical protein Vretimale_12369 [Volvox reticuliferus]
MQSRLYEPLNLLSTSHVRPLSLRGPSCRVSRTPFPPVTGVQHPTRPSGAARGNQATKLSPHVCHSNANDAAGATSSTRREVLRLVSTGGLMLSLPASVGGPVGAQAHATTATAPNAAAGAAVASVAAPGSVERVDLAPGLNISRVVKGCWQLSGGHRGERQSDRTSGQAAIEDFGKFTAAGITTFDAADHYGPAEVLIGRYLAANPDRQPPNTQVLTKYCVFSRRDMAGINQQAVTQAVNLSRNRLGVDRVDLMQYYWGDYDVKRYVDGALYLSELASSGLIGHVGVTNFDVPRMEAMTRAGVRIASNQLQYSLLDRRPENGMAQFCAANGIAMLPYGVLAGGFLSERYLGVPASKVNVDTYSKGKYAGVITAVGGWEWFQSLLQALEGVASKHGTSISNVATRWVLDRPGVAGVILGARNADHVQDHVRLFSFRLDEQDLAVIQEVLDRGRRPTSDCYTWERGGEW